MPARRVASTYSIAGLTYENGCSASNTKGRLTSENQNRITHTNEGFQMPFISVGKENTSAVPPLMVKTAANPAGLPKEVFDGFQAQLAANRAQFYYDVPAGQFYGYNRR